jgi:S-methylmethionine-dependent homocysteine/selenocysteine methylase
METTLIFHAGLDLPHFTSFVLLDDEEGVRALREYFLPYVEIAPEAGVGIVLDTPTWRANADWGERLGYSTEELADVNRRGIRLLERLREETGDGPQIVISAASATGIVRAARAAGIPAVVSFTVETVGGCCGTDHRHIGEICRVWAA